MTSASSPNSSEPNPLDAIIASYLEAVERGDKPDRDRLMLDHPQLASELRAFFADLDRVHQAAGKPADYEATVIGMKEPTPGTILGGRYKLLENIGEGGMGSVWVAEQQQPVKRKVAIKLVKAGMDSKQVLARFEAERQALAVMDHPNIAKVFDGGMTDQGRPYFVMEYVKGIPFTEYCDRVKLSLKERLILFIPVCHAVQHAHHKGIVHRDLKPSNILICLYDGKPVPKVIDFGLAKAMHQPLTEKSIHTGHGVMVGTPVYMSPEQAEHNNLDVDTRTDIYSLGVVLYELLVGTTPLERQQLQQAAFDEILRLIKEVEPPRPSVRLSASGSLPSIAAQRSIEPKDLRKSLTGDLDWIVMKSLDKERSRRYETANGFAQDIERFLNEEPVEACPPSRSYLLKKFVKKHRGQITAAGAVVLALLLGVLTTTWFAIDARISANKATIATQEKEVEKQNALTAAREKEEQRLLAVDKAAKLEKKSYHLSLQAANRALQAGELDAARKTLLEVPEKLRGWEWQYLNVESDSALFSVAIPAGTTIKANSPDGAFALLEHKGKPAGPFSLMHAFDGQIICEIKLPDVEEVPAVSISADARRIVLLGINQSDPIIGLESTLYVWDRDRRSVIWKQMSSPKKNGILFSAHGRLPAHGVSISADARRVAVNLHTYDQTSGENIAKSFLSSNEGYVIDLSDLEHKIQIGAFVEGKLNEDGSILVDSFSILPDITYVDKSDISTTELSDVADNGHGFEFTGDKGIIAFRRTNSDRWYLYDVLKKQQIAELDDMIETEALAFYDGGRRSVSVISGFLTYWVSKNFHKAVTGIRARSGCTDVFVDLVSRCVYVYSSTRIDRYPLFTDRQLLRLHEMASQRPKVWCHGSLMAVSENVKDELIPLMKSFDSTSAETWIYREYTTGIAMGMMTEYWSEDDVNDPIVANNTGDSLIRVSSETIRIHDSLTGKQQHSVSLSGRELSEILPLGLIVDSATQRVAVWGSDNSDALLSNYIAFICDLKNGSVVSKITLGDRHGEGIVALIRDQVWYTNRSQLKCFDIKTSEITNPAIEIIGDAMSVSASEDLLAVVQDDHVRVVSFPELRPVSEFRVMHHANSKIRWGLDDTRLVVSNENLMSLCEVATSEVLLTLPKDNVLSGGLFYKPVPFRERWPAIQAVDEAESGPLVTEQSAAELKGLIEKADTEVATFDDAAKTWEAEFLADETTTTAEKICRLRVLYEVERYFEQFTEQTRGSLKAFQAAAEALSADNENAHFAELLLLIRSKWRPSVNALNDTAWELAATGNSSPKQYEAALELSTEAKTLDSKAPNVLITLALANYRCGNFQAAIAESVEADRILAGTSESGSVSICQILIAMSQNRMGMDDESRKKFNELKDRVASGAVKLEDVSRKLFEEAESLFAAPVPKE